MRDRVVHVEHVWGTVVSIAVPLHRCEGAAARAGIDQVVAWLHTVDSVFSTYVPDSEISMLRTGRMDRAECSDDVADVMARCEHVRRLSHGRFDPWAVTGGFDPSGLVAYGADLQPATLLNAYRAGLFPMPVSRRRLGWFSPTPRGVLPMNGLHVSRSLRRSARRFDIRVDTAFEATMRECGDERRPHGWIDQPFIDAYTELHRLGWAHSFEVWLNDELVGGLYGVRIDGFFAGESMFHLETDASKVALMRLMEMLRADGVVLVDTQWCTPHLASLGCIEVPRRDYLGLLDSALS